MKTIANINFFADAIRERLSKGIIFRNARTRQYVRGEFESSLTQQLRFDGWRGLGRPSYVGDFAKENGMLRISTGDPSFWEEASWRGRGWSVTDKNGVRTFPEGKRWRNVPHWKTIIALPLSEEEKGEAQ
jgi:hypothetical protein